MSTSLFQSKSKSSPVVSAPLPSNPPNQPIEVHIEILSNWGHDTRVGLTEIQLFDNNKQRIDVDENDVMVRNVERMRGGDVMSLFNGRYKA